MPPARPVVYERLSQRCACRPARARSPVDSARVRPHAADMDEMRSRVARLREALRQRDASTPDTAGHVDAERLVEQRDHELYQVRGRRADRLGALDREDDEDE